MSGIFERLQKRMDIDAQEGGISPLDLANLPPDLRKIMRYMLREYELLYTELCEWADEQSVSKTDLDQSLDVLTKQMWLIKRGEGDRVRYQANLRRKAGSKLAQGIWSELDSRIASLAANRKTNDDSPAKK